MVEPVGQKIAGTVREPRPLKVEPAAASTRPAAVATDTAQTARAAGEAADLKREMVVKPPVDAERVQVIKRAIAEGRFPIQPAKIADRLIAFQLGWPM